MRRAQSLAHCSSADFRPGSKGNPSGVLGTAIHSLRAGIGRSRAMRQAKKHRPSGIVRITQPCSWRSRISGRDTCSSSSSKTCSGREPGVASGKPSAPPVPSSQALPRPRCPSSTDVSSVDAGGIESAASPSKEGCASSRPAPVGATVWSPTWGPCRAPVGNNWPSAGGRSEGGPS